MSNDTQLSQYMVLTENQPRCTTPFHGIAQGDCPILKAGPGRTSSHLDMALSLRIFSDMAVLINKVISPDIGLNTIRAVRQEINRAMPLFWHVFSKYNH